MKISATTFESRLRERLLDVIYAQWHDLGFPFAQEAPGSREVIDPEALFWASLAFVESEPHLREAVVDWHRSRGTDLIQQRLRHFSRSDRLRAALWGTLRDSATLEDQADAPVARSLQPRLASEAGHGARQSRLGRHAVGVSTLLLQARYLLGGDTRHFLLIYLLANSGGAKLRDVAKWSGYTYRAIADSAARWQSAGVLRVDHGSARLLDSAPWQALLRRPVENVVLIDWFVLFESCITLLSGLGKVREKGLPIDGPVPRGLCRESLRALGQSVLNRPADDSPTVVALRELFAEVDRRRASA